YVINENDSQELVRLRGEQEPRLLPPLVVQNGKFIRTDSGEEVMLRGYHYGIDQKFWNVVEIDFTNVKEWADGNLIALDLGFENLNNEYSMQKLSQMISYGRN